MLAYRGKGATAAVNCELGWSSTMAARVSAALQLKSEAAGRLGLQRASRMRSFGLYRDRAWRGRPRADRRSVGVRFDTEPEEEEGDADVRPGSSARQREKGGGLRPLALVGCWAEQAERRKNGLSAKNSD